MLGWRGGELAFVMSARLSIRRLDYSMSMRAGARPAAIVCAVRRYKRAFIMRNLARRNANVVWCGAERNIACGRRGISKLAGENMTCCREKLCGAQPIDGNMSSS